MNLDQPIESYDNLQKALQYGAGAARARTSSSTRRSTSLLSSTSRSREIEVTCDKAGAKVSVDGKDVFVAPGKSRRRARSAPASTRSWREAGLRRRASTRRTSARGEHVPDRAQAVHGRGADPLHAQVADATWMPYAVIGGRRARSARSAASSSCRRAASFNDFDSKIASCNRVEQRRGLPDDDRRPREHPRQRRHEAGPRRTSATALGAAADRGRRGARLRQPREPVSDPRRGHAERA